MSIYPPDSDPEADSEASFADHGDDGATTAGLFDEAIAEHAVPAHTIPASRRAMSPPTNPARPCPCPACARCWRACCLSLTSRCSYSA